MGQWWRKTVMVLPPFLRHHLHGVHTLSRQLEGREEEVGEREEGGSSGRERSTMGAESCCCASNFHGETWDRPQSLPTHVLTVPAAMTPSL